MRIPTHLLSLPSSLLIFISTYAQTSSSESQWPYNLPPHVKYFPEDEVHVKRSLSIQSQLATQTALVIRKMSPDEGEMFFLDYWQFDLQSSPRLEGPIPIPRRKPTSIVDSTDSAFSNSSDHLFPPFLPHAQSSLHYKQFLRFFRRTIVQRDFQCPTGTNNCSSIQRPNNCCATDETCVIVADTGDGDVGCCPSGSACGGSVSSCDTGAGYTSCPNSPNGGCCIPGFTCQDIGCVASNTATTTTTLPTATVTTGESSKTTTTSSSTPTPTSSSGTTAGAPIPAPSTPVLQVLEVVVVPQIGRVVLQTVRLFRAVPRAVQTPEPQRSLLFGLLVTPPRLLQPHLPHPPSAMSVARLASMLAPRTILADAVESVVTVLQPHVQASIARRPLLEPWRLLQQLGQEVVQADGLAVQLMKVEDVVRVDTVAVQAVLRRDQEGIKKSERWHQMLPVLQLWGGVF
ncbi:MAG: hypothetical protein M1820_009296 [Bogoriella megaspora]|nr:MAG: hypothetical protein M1820_009296 [Bogoriella megaspora]